MVKVELHGRLQGLGKKSYTVHYSVFYSDQYYTLLHISAGSDANAASSSVNPYSFWRNFITLPVNSFWRN